MDVKRKKEILNEWKNRHPEMGVISFRCKETNESFLGISKDTKADINSNCFKLSGGMHPNKQLSELWRKYGESGFEISVIKTLKYENPTKNHTPKLEALLEQCLAVEPKSRKIRFGKSYN